MLWRGVVGVQKDLTRGSISKTLVSFALPFIVANFFQALYGATDLLVVGYFCPVETVSAVATGAQVMQFLTCFITGLTTSGTILIGRYLGARKTDLIRQVIYVMLILFMGLALLITVLLLLFNAHILHIIQVPSEAFREAYHYVMICSCGVIFIFLYNSISAILRGLGNSKIPMYIVAMACVINFILNYIFISQFNLGASGVAISTIVSQAVSVLVGFLYVRAHSDQKVSLKDIRWNKIIAKKLFALAVPLSLQDTLIPLSFMCLYAIANSMGTVSSAAYGIVCRLNGFLMLPAGSFAMALTALVAQNIGAGNIKRSRTSLFISIGYSLFFGLIFLVWQLIYPYSAIGIFSTSPDVLKEGALFLKSFSWDYILVPFVFCMNAFMSGCGYPMLSAINNISTTFLIRIPLGFLLGTKIGATLFDLGKAVPLTSLCSIIIGACMIYYVYKHLQKKHSV